MERASLMKVQMLRRTREMQGILGQASRWSAQTRAATKGQRAAGFISHPKKNNLFEHSKGGKGGKGRNKRRPKCDIEDFIGTRTYEQDGLCEKTFESVISCDGNPGDRHLCAYEEESMDGGSSSFGTCVAFDPQTDLKYDRKNKTCVIGGERGLELKSRGAGEIGISWLVKAKQNPDPNCDVKYNVRIVKNVESHERSFFYDMNEEDDSALLLYFSRDLGMTFYNLETPRVATNDERVRARRMQGCNDYYYDRPDYYYSPWPINGH
mmetsp:Transcript_182/g.445  ORF Transcript_182/g.445 Transcript_182/m.445 type:complete len:266 (-) Transcript_182:71-868(-)